MNNIMNYEPLFSFIIPVFNAENTIQRCLDSIYFQNNRSFEVIVVNDGSTDETAKILEKYMFTHEYLKVIDLPNGGVSKARNRGILDADGEFIIFVDSDDYIDENYLNYIIENLVEGTDLYIFGYSLIIENTGETFFYSPKESCLNTITEFNDSLGDYLTNSLLNSPCNKVYLKSLIEKNEILFNEELSLGEDLVFNLNYIRYCSKIKTINKPLYNYINHSNTSLSKKFRDDLLLNQIELNLIINKYCQDMNCVNKRNTDSINEYFFNSLIFVLMNALRIEKRSHGYFISILRNDYSANIILSYRGKIKSRLFVRNLYKLRMFFLIYLLFRAKRHLVLHKKKT